MNARNCGREHGDFKEVFSVAYKGLQCAFVSTVGLFWACVHDGLSCELMVAFLQRNTMNTVKLDKEAIGDMTERHLTMYLSQ